MTVSQASSKAFKKAGIPVGILGESIHEIADIATGTTWSKAEIKKGKEKKVVRFLYKTARGYKATDEDYTRIADECLVRPNLN